MMRHPAKQEAGPSVPETVAEPLLEMASLKAAYQAFEENFAALQEARQIQLVGMPDGGVAPPNQAEVVKKLEVRDRQLRATILRMSKEGN